MRTLALLFATVVTLLIASAASAALPIQYVDFPPDSVGSDPTVKSCVAFGAYGQKCKRCHPSFREDGSVEKWTCVNEMNSFNFCTCGDMSRGGCYPKGLCQYVN